MKQGVAAYAAVTAAYWAFMATDGALRMLVLLHFHALGFSPLQLAYLFVLYEIAGIVTNLTAGWLAARFGLSATLYAGLALQIAALLALTQLDPAWSVTASVIFVMAVQAASGVAKDLTKTSSKSAVKLLAPAGGALLRWTAILTGSKNAIKGLGFFLGAGLLATFGFTISLLLMAAALAAILVAIVLKMPPGLPGARKSARFAEVFSRDPRINRLAAARFFLFGARDVWFVVAVPIFLTAQFSDGTPEGTRAAFFATGAFMAAWIIGYGIIQGSAPRWLGADRPLAARGPQARTWALILVAVLTALALVAALAPPALTTLLIAGLLLFGAVFAINSALHSYLILALSSAGRVSMDVGFYYMANAGGRLVGTLLSGLGYQFGGLTLCLAVSAAMAAASAFMVRRL